MLSDEDWQDLMTAIDRQRCTPFLGAGACEPLLPLASELVKQLASESTIPEKHACDLPGAAQYLAVNRFPARPKQSVADIIGDRLAEISDAKLKQHGLHCFLAKLPIETYLTTNYDDLMERALAIEGRQYVQDYCRWNRFVDNDSPLMDPGKPYKPDRGCPLVYHLHGTYKEPNSIVVAESDYVDFIVNTFRDRSIPNCVKDSIARTSLLMIGYSLDDINFRIILKGILGSIGNTSTQLSVTVQLKTELQEDRDYFERYIKHLGAETWKIYWGDAESFVGELRERWRVLQDQKLASTEP